MIGWPAERFSGREPQTGCPHWYSNFAVNRGFLQIVVDLKKFPGFLIFIMDRDRIARRQIPAVLQAEIFDGLFPQRGILPKIS